MYHTFDPNCPPRQSWDPATTLFAVRGAGAFWDEHTTGFNVVQPNGANAWLEDGRPHNRSYLVLRSGEPTGQPGWSSQRLVAKAIDDLLCAAKPNVRAKTDDSSGVRFLVWDTQLGKGVFNQSKLHLAPTQLHANLQVCTPTCTPTCTIDSNSGQPARLIPMLGRWPPT